MHLCHAKTRLFFCFSIVFFWGTVFSQQCNTSTFYMHMPAPAGQKIELKALQTIPGGDFIAAANITQANNIFQGLMTRMTNGGSIIKQQSLSINNNPASILSMRTDTTGNIIVAGIVYDGLNDVFIAQLKSDFSVTWVRLLTMPSSPLDVVIEQSSQIVMAVQLNNAVACDMLTPTGTVVWASQLSAFGISHLVGIDVMYDGSFGLSINYVTNGKQMASITSLKSTDGSVAATNFYGDTSQQNRVFHSNYFNSRLNILSVINTGAGFQTRRDIFTSTAHIETRHTYTLPINIDMTISAAMDNAGDAMAFCSPQDGKLLFVKQLAYYQSSPEVVKTFTVPVGSSVAGIARSFDGGYLFCLNTPGLNEVIFIKTDSIGTLSGCGSSTNQINSIEATNFQTVIGVGNRVNATISATSAVILWGSQLLTTNFDCNQNYCPAPPIEDSCMETYYKTYRSNSYIDNIKSFFLMRNNNIVTCGTRYDRILGKGNLLTPDIRLFDEKGHFIKGLNVLPSDPTSGFSAQQMDDKSFMTIAYSAANSIPYYTFTLLTDSLNVVWSKTVNTYPNYEFGSNGSDAADWHKDAEGNYYFSQVRYGIVGLTKPAIMVYKMDAMGNQLWMKEYQYPKGGFGVVSLTSTASSLIAIISGNQGGSASIRFDKSNGQVLNNFFYQDNYSGVIYRRTVKTDQNHIFFVGTTGQDNVLFSVYDTLGQPLRFKYLTDNNYTIGSTAIKNGNMYGALHYFSGTGSNNVLIKIDSNLNIVFMNEYPQDINKSRVPRGLSVDDLGNVYTGGNLYYGSNGNYGDLYIIKYNSKGELGTCNYISTISASLTPIVPSITPATETPLSTFFTVTNVPISFTADVNGQQLSAILCGSVPTCSSVKVDGPNAVCQLNKSFAYTTTQNAGCTLQPLWIYDTATTVLDSSTAATTYFHFKKQGNIWLKARLNIGCRFYDDSMLVKVQIGPTSFSLGNDTTLCPKDSLILHAGNNFHTYNWQDGSTDSILIVKTQGQYFVAVTNVCGNSFADTVQVSLASVPPLSIGPDTIICRGDTLSLQASPGFATYNWHIFNSTAGQGQHITLLPAANTVVSVIGTTQDGCKAIDSISVKVLNARPINLGADTSFCNHDSLQLFGGNGYLQYIWSTGSTTSSINVFRAGTYWVKAKDVNNCFATDTLIVQQVFALPVVDLGNDQNLCKGTSLVFNAGNFSHYLWQDGSNNRTYSASQTGSYWVQVRDNNNCKASDTVVIKNILPSPVNFLPKTDSLCQYDKIQLQPTGNFQGYLWSTGETTPSILVSQVGRYTLTATDSNGCSGTDTTDVVQKYCRSGVFIPTAFTPNGDQLNDVFRAKVFGVAVSFQLRIYDRYGSLVFFTTDPLKGWDGNYNGQPAASGAFVWQCSYQLQGGQPFVQKGIMVLVR